MIRFTCSLIYRTLVAILVVADCLRGLSLYEYKSLCKLALYGHKDKQIRQLESLSCPSLELLTKLELQYYASLELYYISMLDAKRHERPLG